MFDLWRWKVRYFVVTRSVTVASLCTPTTETPPFCADERNAPVCADERHAPVCADERNAPVCADERNASVCADERQALVCADERYMYQLIKDLSVWLWSCPNEKLEYLEKTILSNLESQCGCLSVQWQHVISIDGEIQTTGERS